MKGENSKFKIRGGMKTEQERTEETEQRGRNKRLLILRFLCCLLLGFFLFELLRKLV
jgi:hypothetical protein